MLEPAILIDACHTQRKSGRSENSGTLTAATRPVCLPHVAIVRAPGLLPMLYRPTELAEDLGVSDRTVREWLLKGLPHEHDERGHLWIDGRKAVEWVNSLRHSRARPKLADDEAYCLPCHRPVKLLNPARTQRGKQILLHGCCPNCGTSIHRGIRNDQSD